MILKNNKYTLPGILGILVLMLHSCSVPLAVTKQADTTLPVSFSDTAAAQQTVSSTAQVNWKNFFEDPFLTQLIDSALVNNREMNILLQRISLVQNEIQARRGEYLPFVSVGAGADVEKVGKYTRNGAIEENQNITEDHEFPKLLSNIQFGLFASWELDIWKKLRTSQQQAVLEYMASQEGRNFMISNLVAEIADSYYELIALDNQLKNLQNNISIQQNALETARYRPPTNTSKRF